MTEIQGALLLSMVAFIASDVTSHRPFEVFFTGMAGLFFGQALLKIWEALS